MRSLTNCDKKKGVIPQSIAGTRTGSRSRPQDIGFMKKIDSKKFKILMEVTFNYVKSQ